MVEPVYITEEQRDLILELFGGVRKERAAEMVEALESAKDLLDWYAASDCEAGEHDEVCGRNVCLNTGCIAMKRELIRSALSKASQTTGGENE